VATSFLLTLVARPSLSTRHLRSLRNTSFLQMGRASLGSSLHFGAAQGRPNPYPPSSRRRISMVSLRLTQNEGTRYRLSWLQCVWWALLGLSCSYQRTLQVTGRIITGSSIHDSFVFLNVSTPIWAKSMDTPRMESPSQGTTSNKLFGHCVWPLSIPLPRTVIVPTGSGEMRSCRLPETFLERNTRVSVQYDLTITISRGRLRSDNRFARLNCRTTPTDIFR